MAVGQAGYLALATAFTGILSFICGVIGENKKPSLGTPTTSGNLTICVFPSDPSIALGALSVIFLFIASIFGVVSIFFPYGKQSVPLAALGRSKMLLVFGLISTALFFVTEALLMWVTITEKLHRTHNVHVTPYDCPTAKTGLMGGAAFLALDTTLFWLICQMLTMNAREDHFDFYDDEDGKGSYGHVVTADFTDVPPHSAAKA